MALMKETDLCLKLFVCSGSYGGKEFDLSWKIVSGSGRDEEKGFLVNYGGETFFYPLRTILEEARRSL